MIKIFIFVEDGSVDLNELKNSVGDGVLVVPYRQGATPPTIQQPREPVSEWGDNSYRETKRVLDGLLNGGYKMSKKLRYELERLYVASSSYIMQGSSGGVLLNSDLDVIGITTIVRTVNGEFDRSFSVSTFNFQNDVEKVPNYDLSNLMTFLRPEETEYIRFFNALKNKTDMVRTEEGEGVTSYSYSRKEESVNGDEIAYSLSETHTFDSDFYMCISTDIYWAGGDRREISLYGYWSPTVGFDNFIFEFKYTWANGQYYTVQSTNINYSTNIDLTLNDYITDSSYSYTITAENIVYAREQFNYVYETLLQAWAIE